MSKIKGTNVFFLPMDMWHEIFKFLNTLDIICVIPSVCNSWRKSIVNSYFHTYLKDHISFLNIKNIEELFNNSNLLQKYKRYLFRKYIQQKAHHFAHFSELSEKPTFANTIYVINNKNDEQFIEKELVDIQMYCKLFNLPTNTEPLRLGSNASSTNNQSHQSSCFGFYQYPQKEFTNNNNTITTPSIIDEICVLKTVMLGNASVGKTAFLTASVNKQFQNATYTTTIGVEFQNKIHKLGKNYPNFKLQMWDTAGPERFRCITNAYYRGTDGFFICFDLTNRESFRCVREWKKEIDIYALKKTEVMLLGLKLDLIENRVVEREEVEKLEFEMELIYEEISSKEMNNVDSPTWYLVLMKYCFN